MPNQIVITGDLVQLQETRILRQGRLEDIYPHLVEARPVTIPNLPRTAVMFHWDETNPREKILNVLCELTPGIKNLIKTDGYNRRRYRLAMPWTYFWFTARTPYAVNDTNHNWSIDTYKVFHAREQYRTIDTPMIPAILPNVYEDGRICFGSTGADPRQPLNDRIDQLVNEWYLTTFNHDLGVRYPYLGDNSYARWVRESRENRNCWMNWDVWHNTDDWSLSHYTVRQLLNQNGVTPEPIILEGTIPDISERFTFGQAEDWLRRRVSPPYRARLLRALENIVADDPEFVPAENPVENSTQPEDDGGTVIDG